MSEEKTLEQRLQDELGFVPSVGGGVFEPVEEGTYDATIHAVIQTGLRPPPPGSDNKTPSRQILVLFELPDVVRAMGDKELPHIVKLSYLNLTASVEKGNFAKLLRAAGLKPDEQNIRGFMLKEGLEQLLGKSLMVTIEHGESKAGKIYEKVKSVAKRVSTKKALEPVRKPFLFNPRHPDLEIFNNTLIYYTKSDIMEALDADQFPAELHKAWAEAQDKYNAEHQGKEGAKFSSTKPVVSSDPIDDTLHSTESIE